jgi:hypothetical protein
MHTHPEIYVAPPAVTPRRLRDLVRDLGEAIQNLDSETLRVLAPRDREILNKIAGGLRRLDQDGLPDAGALRPRDLHYAGYYHEIQFARLAKQSGVFDVQRGLPADAVKNDVRQSISTGDDMAHVFHTLRIGVGINERLPASVVAPDRPGAVPGRAISQLIREVLRNYQTPAELVREAQVAENAKAREQYRNAVDWLAQDYARIAGDAKAAEPVRAYAARQVPPLGLETIHAMREGLRVAADPTGDYRGLPEEVQKACLMLCYGLEGEGDWRLIHILDAADARGRASAAETRIDEGFPALSIDENEDREHVETPDLEPERDFGEERGPGRGR